MISHQTRKSKAESSPKAETKGAAPPAVSTRPPAWVNGLPLQPKLTVNEPGDPYEQVMRMPAPGSIGKHLQRCACGGAARPDGECESCKARRLNMKAESNSELRLQPISASSRRVARGEKWDAFTGVGPWDAYKAKSLADRALTRAQETGLPGLHNGPADAWRHCYWNCTMTAEIGEDQAKIIADNHEIHGGGPAIESQMDYHNNHEGRACGGVDCDQCCQGRLDAGQLRIIDEVNGTLIPSSSPARSTTPRVGSGDYYYGDTEPRPAGAGSDGYSSSPSDAGESLPGGVPDMDAGVP
jgi:hypothetical protein